MDNINFVYYLVVCLAGCCIPAIYQTIQDREYRKALLDKARGRYVSHDSYQD